MKCVLNIVFVYIRQRTMEIDALIETICAKCTVSKRCATLIISTINLEEWQSDVSKLTANVEERVNFLKEAIKSYTLSGITVDELEIQSLAQIFKVMPSVAAIVILHEKQHSTRMIEWLSYKPFSTL